MRLPTSLILPKLLCLKEESMQILILLKNLVSLKDTTTGVNIFEAIKHVIDVLGLRLNNICEVTTDGAPVMIWRSNGTVSLIEKEMYMIH